MTVKYSDNDIDAALCWVANEIGETPTANQYRENKLDDMPSARQIINRRGDWMTAISAAGLDPDPRRHVGHRQWTREDTVQTLKIAICQVGECPSKSQYRSLGLLPSTNTITKQWADEGGWRAATAKAKDQLIRPAKELLENGPRMGEIKRRSNEPIQRGKVNNETVSWLPCHGFEAVVYAIITANPEIREKTPRKFIKTFEPIRGGFDDDTAPVLKRCYDDDERWEKALTQTSADPKWTRGEFRSAIKAAAKAHGEPLSVEGYSEWRDGDSDVPSASTIQNGSLGYGTWKRACDDVDVIAASMDPQPPTGDRLAKLRKEQGWDQKELGERVGVSRGTISNYECGDRYPRTETALRLIEIFEVDEAVDDNASPN